ncbi:hypothetical protein E4U43_004539 [Claviceps pusilla]|uniref:Uncharacterized protein n=1 Tax=Claviceps pusilla TaxID=123648 RepID=A0A9P7N391_9HYPO|nr:hypothetical protein E4U43_004539 [Claviceps pusilla]
MEFYLTPPNAKLEEQQSQNNSVDFSPDPRPEACPPPVFGGFEDRTSQVGHAAGIVADQLLMEQRPALIRALAICPYLGQTGGVYICPLHEYVARSLDEWATGMTMVIPPSSKYSIHQFHSATVKDTAEYESSIRYGYGVS